jgi:hypothetical protein
MNREQASKATAKLRAGRADILTLRRLRDYRADRYARLGCRSSLADLREVEAALSEFERVPA